MKKLLSAWVVVVSILASSTGAYALSAEQNTALHFIKTGVGQLQSGDYEGARNSFEQAIRYQDAFSAAHTGLGIACFHLRDDREAERELSRAVEINPKEVSAYRFLGELAYRQDDLEAAVAYWEKAVALNPKAADLRARLERTRKEHQAEKNFNREVTSHFLIKYEGSEKREAGRIVLRILEDAYSEVGQALSYYPNEEIQVVLYSERQFQAVTDAPGWSGGIFDGKIRIPIGGIEAEPPGLRGMLYHEYTHAAVRAITPRCPTWLNEGLSEYMEGRRIDGKQREALRKLIESGKMPALAGLEGSFMGLDNKQAVTAYLVSLSAVRYMIDTCGIYRLKTVLESLAEGRDTATAISNGTLLSYEAFERGWRRSLE